mmetsp:Transcript_11513/g.14051  ORF Transcript_11513/g.14051 Transcript_11513/m.14051 type:complete len:207 (+) Transcript_11513:121-741(+)
MFDREFSTEMELVGLVAELPLSLGVAALEGLAPSNASLESDVSSNIFRSDGFNVGTGLGSRLLSIVPNCPFTPSVEGAAASSLLTAAALSSFLLLVAAVLLATSLLLVSFFGNEEEACVAVVVVELDSLQLSEILFSNDDFVISDDDILTDVGEGNFTVVVTVLSVVVAVFLIVIAGEFNPPSLSLPPLWIVLDFVPSFNGIDISK